MGVAWIDLWPGIGPGGRIMVINEIRYSIDKSKILLDVSFPTEAGITYSAVIYEMDDYGQFIRKSVPTAAKDSFPIKIK